MITTVLHLTEEWLPQTQTWLYHQIRYLPDSIDSHIACEYTVNLDQFRLANLHSLADYTTLRGFTDKVLRKFGARSVTDSIVGIAKKTKATVAHSHFGSNGWSNIPAVEGAGLRHVVTFYGSDVSYLPNQQPVWRERYAELFETAAVVLSEGPQMATRLRHLGCPPEKLRIHHLGVNVDQLAFCPRRWTPPEPLKILMAASFREKKGIPYALEALGRLQHELNIEITLIGDAGTGARSLPEKAKILDVIERLNLGPRIRLLGYQPYEVLLDEAYRHHIFLSPSVTAADGDTEGGAPVSIIEMMATGMPIVSTKHCDIPEVVVDGVTGLLAEERDIEGLVLRLQWLIHHREQWPQMAWESRHKVEREFNVHVQGMRLAAIYESLTNGKPLGPVTPIA